MKKMIYLAIPLLVFVLVITNKNITIQPATAQSQLDITQLSYGEKTKTIVIDAGHGGYDSGGISYNGIYEKDITLDVSLLLGEKLEEAGYEVIYTRTSDTVSWPSDNVADLSARVQIAEEADADLYISLHTNSSESYDDGAYGVEGYVSSDNVETYQLCESILDSLTALNYTMNRGVKTTDTSSLYVIDKNSIPAILLEIGFLSDSDDAAYVSSSQGCEAIANAIYTSIIENS